MVGHVSILQPLTAFFAARRTELMDSDNSTLPTFSDGACIPSITCAHTTWPLTYIHMSTYVRYYTCTLPYIQTQACAYRLPVQATKSLWPIMSRGSQQQLAQTATFCCQARSSPSSFHNQVLCEPNLGFRRAWMLD